MRVRVAVMILTDRGYGRTYISKVANVNGVAEGFEYTDEPFAAARFCPEEDQELLYEIGGRILTSRLQTHPRGEEFVTLGVELEFVENDDPTFTDHLVGSNIQQLRPRK